MISTKLTLTFSSADKLPLSASHARHPQRTDAPRVVRLITLLFGAIYKILPDRRIEWHDVMIGAVVTALLFTIEKFLLGLYIGSSSMASSYGTA